ncbi:unnamed protein product, partial [Prorocentrum cordatum]
RRSARQGGVSSADPRNPRGLPSFYAYAVFPDPKVEASGLARRFEEGGEACHWRNVYDFSSNDPACGNWSALSRREAQAVLASFPAAPVGEGPPLRFPSDRFPEDPASGGAAAPAAAARGQAAR